MFPLLSSHWLGSPLPSAGCVEGTKQERMKAMAIMEIAVSIAFLYMVEKLYLTLCWMASVKWSFVVLKFPFKNP